MSPVGKGVVPSLCVLALRADEADEARTVVCDLLCSVLYGLVFPEALQAARGGRRRYAH